MVDPIRFENEEQANEFFDNCLIVKNPGIDRDATLVAMREMGYFIQSELERAQIEYDKNPTPPTHATELIHHLKEEIERLESI